MSSPFTSDLIKKPPLLYRRIPNCHSDDVDESLDELKHDIIMLSELNSSQKKIIIKCIDTWFPAFNKKEEEKIEDKVDPVSES